ncbi:LssY C-terminal domain-containing protein [Starkeya koreensis]|uniref:LssY C-terminal domain-containing protein n=1 Tax=Ancylobacter koreensis TaxID=266121 RepID=A0ABT0DPK6_9HYPH|nr:LssY C-terminal domain-containing protein [Ancylobacter koreensis]MCK0209215.1 LssY C-terminal domain-containing protein [Ancylobacter koreensis]
MAVVEKERRMWHWVLLVVLAWAGLAYILLPRLWTHHERQPGIAHLPMVTQTKQGIPGDPIDVGLVGTRDDVVRAMIAAGWTPADPVTLKSSIEIVGSVLLRRPDPKAPVSPLYYDGRVEDLAFEKEIGRSADRRDHVRFWKVLDAGEEGAPVWLGSATYDKGVGLSHYTGAVTHHIGPDVDAVRDLLVDDLKAAGMVRTLYQVTGVGPTLFGRNGGGDRYYTDGEVWLARLTVNGEKNANPPTIVSPPPAVLMKDNLWRQIAGLVGDR